MPSLVQRKSYGSVTVFWLDRAGAVGRLREAAGRLGRIRSEVEYIGLFGSLAEDRAVPGSDADLILILRESDRRFLDRPLDYLPFFRDVGIDLDLFCYARGEVLQTPLAERALRQSRPLWGQKPETAVADP